MNRQGSICICIIALTILSVIPVECESPPPDPAGTQIVSSHPAPSQSENGSRPVPAPWEGVITALSAPAGTKLFESGGLSIRYPDRFSPISTASLEKIREVAKPEGIDILTILMTGDSHDSIQITRQPSSTSLDGIFEEKEAISQEVARRGSATVRAMTFVTYEVAKEPLADGTGVVKVTAVNTEKETAVTYLLPAPGQMYNFNFIYETMKRAEEQAPVRDAMLRTLVLT